MPDITNYYHIQSLKSVRGTFVGECHFCVLDGIDFPCERVDCRGLSLDCLVTWMTCIFCLVSLIRNIQPCFPNLTFLICKMDIIIAPTPRCVWEYWILKSVGVSIVLNNIYIFLAETAYSSFLGEAYYIHSMFYLWIEIKRLLLWWTSWLIN